MNPVRILLIDSNPTVLQLITRFLQQHDDVVVAGTAGDGQAGLAQAQSLQPQVIVVDLGMPGLMGLETISRLRAAMPGAGLIAISLLIANSYREAVLAAGADEFVPKSALLTNLLPAIRRVVQVGRHIATTGSTGAGNHSPEGGPV